MHSARLVVAACVAVSLTAGVAAQTIDDPAVRVETVATGLSQPTTLAFLGPDDMLVLEKQTGRVRRVLNGVLQPGFVLDLPVNADGERGLLGIAVNTETPPKVFLYFSEAAADGGMPFGHRVYRYDWNPGLGVLDNPLLLLDLPYNPSHACHSGGIVTLGLPPAAGHGLPGDGSILYVVIGDLGLAGQTSNTATSSPPDDKAVVFALLQDGTPAPGNPFVPYCSTTTTQTCPSGTGCPGGETCITEVAKYHAYGIRNSFGMAIDPATGDLWETENGPFFYDEINRIEAGFNGGWVRIVGPVSRDAQGTSDLFEMPGGASMYGDPEFSWTRPIAPTAIVFPAGSQLGLAYDDVALVADANHGQIYRFPLNATRDGFDFTDYAALQDLVADGNDGVERDLLRIGSGFSTITDLEVGPDGYVYVSALFHGNIYRIVPHCPRAPQMTCREPLISNRSFLLMRDHPTDDQADRLVWRWLKGEQTFRPEFGIPLVDESYSLCVYDGTGLRLRATVPPAGTCGGVDCWQDLATLRYRDPSGTNDGVNLIRLRDGDDLRARVVVKARGPSLALPPLDSLVSPLTVQMVRSGGDVCWSATYSFPPVLRSDAEYFRDRAD